MLQARLINGDRALIELRSGTSASFFTTGTAPIQVPTKHHGAVLVTVAPGERIAQHWVVDDPLGRATDATILLVVRDAAGNARLAIKHGEGELATVVGADQLAGRTISECRFLSSAKTHLEVTIDQRPQTYVLSWQAQLGRAHQRFVSAKPLRMSGNG